MGDSEPVILAPGTWGCAHGSGLLGQAIRAAEIRMSRSPAYPHGDRQAAWAGHCVVYIGQHDFGHGREGAIVQAEWPKVVISPAAGRGDVIWATGQPLTAQQRQDGVARVLAMVGYSYDVAAYGWYVAKVLGVALTHDLTSLFTDPRWTICSGVVVVEQEAMGVNLGPLRTAATSNPDFVCPADCMRWGLDNGWMGSVPPLDWK